MAEETEWLDGGDGTCRHLDRDTNRCGIYDDRPVICRVDVMFERVYQQQMTRPEFYRINAQCCQALRELTGVADPR